ncbi:MAG TPA: hypothetical protein VGM65_08515 [Candidatus Udaeobacter sp.]|jgi:hypothetical protein
MNCFASRILGKDQLARGERFAFPGHAPCSLRSVTSWTLYLANELAWFFIFAQAKKNRRAQFPIARPLIRSLPATSPAALAGLTVYLAASRLARFGLRLVAPRRFILL